MTTATTTQRRDSEMIRRACAYVAQQLLRAGDATRWPLPIEIARAVVAYAVVDGEYDVPPAIGSACARTLEMVAWPLVDYATGAGVLHRADLLAEQMTADEAPADLLDVLRLYVAKRKMP